MCKPEGWNWNPYYQRAKAILQGNQPLALAEQHNKKHGRELARYLMAKGHVHAFYVEYSPHSSTPFGTIKQGKYDQLEDIRKRVEGGEFENEKLIPYEVEDVVTNLVSGDAEPNLADLIAFALMKGIPVYPIDAKNTLGADAEAKDRRDKSAAKHFVRFHDDKFHAGKLMLYGADHFFNTAIAERKQGKTLGHQIAIQSDFKIGIQIIDVSNL